MFSSCENTRKKQPYSRQNQEDRIVVPKQHSRGDQGQTALLSITSITTKRGRGRGEEGPTQGVKKDIPVQTLKECVSDI